MDGCEPRCNRMELSVHQEDSCSHSNWWRHQVPASAMRPYYIYVYTHGGCSVSHEYRLR